MGVPTPLRGSFVRASILHPLLALLVALTGCDDAREETSVRAESAPPPGPERPAKAEFVGSSECSTCHGDQAEAWRGSHHDLAMQPANEATVLADFGDVEFEKDGVISRFFRRDGRFFVRTDGADGTLQDFEIGWAFGVEPLQQYLVELPDGRIQALGIAWDSRPASQGGQRFFHVYGDEPIPAGDELHWTGLAQNWNYMCADCHSTAYRKGYDATAKRFEPSWSEIDVGCEACHGPGSLHVDRAREERLGEGSGLVVDLAMPERHLVLAEDSPTRRIVGGEHGTPQIDVCGRCHARRASLRDGYRHGQSLLDSHQPALLREPEYFPDGQIRDEVYVYGSFLQSRMHAEGVVCSDCHDPHALSLRASGDALCAQCHAPEAYSLERHARHAPGEGAPSCADCHMPARTYMVVDPRRDHSFRVPRPDLAESLGVSDACDACHADRPAGWSAEAVRGWLGRDATGLQDFAETFRAAQARTLDSPDPLQRIASDAEQPAIVRATALSHLQEMPTRAGLDLAIAALDDPDPIVRHAALGPLNAIPPEQRVALLGPRLEDPVRAVRIEAARMLAGLDLAELDPSTRQRLRAAVAEYELAQRSNLDRPHAHLNLGNLYAERGETAAAERAYREALALDRRFEPAWVNLVDLLAREGRESDASDTLRAGLEAIPESAALLHALGLHRVRVGEIDAAMEALAAAVEQAPDTARFRYVYAVALRDLGRPEQARTQLEEAYRRAPADPSVLRALLGTSLESGRMEEALAQARALQRLQPDDPQLMQLLEQLEGGAR
jgi:predicted CXXCH cytochrome family protein